VECRASALIASHFAWPVLTAIATVPVCSAFINPMYSFSVGYGASVSASAIAIAVMHATSGAAFTCALRAHIACALFYGTRLAMFLYHRSVTWDEWKERARNAPEARAQGIGKQLLVIALCGLLYSCMSSPMLWHAQNVNAINYAKYGNVIVFGLVAQFAGAVVEAVADHQKYTFKATTLGKTRWCDTGLYAKCRHPNYLGEIVFWIGTYVAGAPAMLTRPVTFVPASVGLFFIVMLMFGAAKRGDKKQATKYADNAEYKAWAESSCSLFPGN